MSYLITHSLLNSWLWLFADYGENKMDEFVGVLNRVERPPNEAMMKGREFENAVNDAINNPQDHDEVIREVASIVRGCQSQVRISKPLNVDGVDYLLYGVADFVGKGTIYDTKFTGNYAVGKYVDFTQHPMYLEIIPEASRFVYLICNGKTMWTEEYERGRSKPVAGYIRDFWHWLNQNPSLKVVYEDKWRAA